MAVVRQDLVDYLRKSCALLDPTIESDSAYKFTDNELELMISNIVSAYCPEYSLLTLPSSYTQAVVLVARKEVLWSLAFANAPYIEWQLDETRMKENVRFDHYAKLIDATEAEIKRLVESGSSLFLAQVKLGEIYISAYNGTARNYNAAVSPGANLTISKIGARTVELDWEKFDNGLVSCFNYYALYINTGTSPIIDEYSGETSPELNGVLVKMFNDIHITKYRVTDLLPETKYHILLVSCSNHDLKGYCEKEFTTLAEV